MEIFILILVVIGIIAVVMLWRWLSKKQQAMYQVNDRFGKPPGDLDKGNLQSIRKHWDVKQNDIPNPLAIDNLTWNDLSMDAVFERINMCSSSMGEEYLYALLHEPTMDLAVLQKRETLLRRLGLAPDLRKKLQTALLVAGKLDNNGLSAFIYNIETKGIDNIWRYRLQALAPLVCLGLMFFSVGLGTLLLIVAAAFNGWTYMKQQWKLDMELNAVKYISAVIRSSQKVAALSDDALTPYTEPLKQANKAFRPLTNRFLQMTIGSDVDWNFLLEYAKLLFMYDFLRFNRVINRLKKHRQDLHIIWNTLGELDAMVSVLSFRQSLQTYCVPQWTEGGGVTLTDAWHPLIQNAVRNSIILDKNCFVTGSNASGKSTFIKTVAVNALLAQTIHTCTARGYKAPPCRVLTSMAVKDDVSEGDSYFIAEIKSLKRVMNALTDAGIRCFCFVDEILKGTNTVERIAASAAIARHMLAYNCLCMVATHDIELPRILGDSFMNVHFSESIEDEGIKFPYLIHAGVSQTRNAIRLLDFMDFDKTIVSGAEDMVQWYIDNQQWKTLKENV